MDPVLPFSEESLVLLAIGAAIPLLTTALTKWAAPDWVKNVVTAALAILATLTQQAMDAILNGEGFHWQEFGQGIVLTWLTAAFAYTKLWRNTPINVGLGRATANKGIGGKPMVQPQIEPEHGTPTPTSRLTPGPFPPQPRS